MLEEKNIILAKNLASIGGRWLGNNPIYTGDGPEFGYNSIKITLPLEFEIEEFKNTLSEDETILMDRDMNRNPIEVIFIDTTGTKSYSDITEVAINLVDFYKTKGAKIELYDTYVNKIQKLFYQYNDLEILKTMVIEIPNSELKTPVEPKSKKESKIK